MAPTMRAERFYADTKSVVIEDVPIPEPGPGDVLVKVRKLDVAFEVVGIKATFEQALDCLTASGRLVAAGMSSQAPTLGPTAMVGLSEKQVLGHLGYQNVDIKTLAKLVSLGRLDLSRSISRIIPPEDIREGIDALERADGNPIRILVQP